MKLFAIPQSVIEEQERVEYLEWCAEAEIAPADYEWRGELKCGSCNDYVCELYELADSQDEADQIYREEEGGLCGRCVTNLILDNRYEILPQSHMDGMEVGDYKGVSLEANALRKTVSMLAKSLGVFLLAPEHRDHLSNNPMAVRQAKTALEHAADVSPDARSVLKDVWGLEETEQEEQEQELDLEGKPVLDKMFFVEINKFYITVEKHRTNMLLDSINEACIRYSENRDFSAEYTVSTAVWYNGGGYPLRTVVAKGATFKGEFIPR